MLSPCILYVLHPLIRTTLGRWKKNRLKARKSACWKLESSVFKFVHWVAKCRHTDTFCVKRRLGTAKYVTTWLDLQQFQKKSLMIHYETLTLFRAYLGFSRWHVYGWFTVNQSTVHILVTFYSTHTKICYIEYCVLRSRPINHTWAHSSLPWFISFVRKEHIVFPSYSQLFYIQPKTNEQSKFAKRYLYTSWWSSIFWFYSHTYFP